MLPSPAAIASKLSARAFDALTVVGLLLASVVVSLRALRDGGLFFDDWWIRGQALYGGGSEENSVFERIGPLWELVGFRPGSFVLANVQNVLIDISPRLLQVTGALTIALLAAAVYAFLVVARLPRIWAAATALLVVTIPVASTTRYWAAAQMMAVAVTLAFAALALIGSGVRREHTGRTVGGIVLFGVAVSTYEIVIPLALLAAFIAFQGGAGLRRIALVTAGTLAAAGIAYFARPTGRNSVQPFGAWDDHARVFLDQGGELLGSSLTPDGPWGWLMLAGVVAITVTALVLARRGTREVLDGPRTAPASAHGSDTVPRAPRGPLTTPAAGALLAVLGLAVVVLGYLTLIPAEPWYQPLQPGQGTRVNGVAAVGYAMVVAGVMIIVSTAITRSVLLAPRVAPGATVALAFLLIGGFAAGYAQENRGDGDQYIAAYTRAQELIAAFEETVPESALRPGTTMLSFGRPGYVAPLVQSLGEWSDLDGALKEAFGSGQIQAYPIFETQEVICGPRGVELPLQYVGGPVYGPGYDRPYGKLLFVQAPERRWTRITSREVCQRELARYPRAALNF